MISWKLLLGQNHPTIGTILDLKTVEKVLLSVYGPLHDGCFIRAGEVRTIHPDNVLPYANLQHGRRLASRSQRSGHGA